MPNYDWLKTPGDTLYASIARVSDLETRVAATEANSVSPITLTELQQQISQVVAAEATTPPSLSPRGQWQATTTYNKFDVVVYTTDGNTYICTSADPTQAIPTDNSSWTIFGERGLTGQTGPQGQKGDPGQAAVANIIPKGTWSATTTYQVNDSVVASDGNSYVALAASTNQNPTTTPAVWGLFVMRGPAGPQGPAAPAASITAADLTPSLQSTLNSAAKLVNGSAEGSWGEIDTGKQFRGKPVFRQDFTLYVNAAPGVVDFTLIAIDNYVDTIISQGGVWSIGFQTERHGIPGTIDNTNASQVILYGTGNRLTWRSKANNTRSGAQAIIIVEYTKK